MLGVHGLPGVPLTTAVSATEAHAQVRTERGIMLVSMLAIFAFSLGQTGVNPLLPAMQRDFNTSTTWSTWIITAFLVVGAATTPLTGRLGDQYGRKPVLQVTLAVLGVASIGAACAPNVGVLIACRAVSGVSGAFLALTLALATQHARAERVGAIIAASATAMTCANIAGVTLVPVLADAQSWRWLYVLVALSVGVALACSFRAVPTAPTTPRGRVDVLGATLLAAAVGLLMLDLTEAHVWGWASIAVVGVFLGAAAAAAIWIAVELRVAEPMIDLRIVGGRSVAPLVAATFLAGSGVFASLMLVSRLVAVPRGESAAVVRLVHYGFDADSTKAGLFLLSGMLSGLVVSVFLRAIAGRLGWKGTLLTILSLAAFGLAGVALWHGSSWQIVVLMLFGGIHPPVTSIAGKLVSDSVPHAQHGTVAGLSMSTFYVGGVVGAQVCAAILTGHAIGGTDVPSETAFSICLFLCAGALLAAVPLVLLSRANQPTG
jgi:MFS family permease